MYYNPLRHITKIPSGHPVTTLVEREAIFFIGCVLEVQAHLVAMKQRNR